MKISTKFLVALSIGLCLSINAYSQWKKIAAPSQWWQTNDIKSYNGKLYAATNAGVYSSDDNGGTWNNLTNGFASSASGSFREIAFTSTGNIFVRTTTSGVVKSMDGGTTWEYDTTKIGFTDVQTIFYDSSSDRVFIGLTWPQYGLYYKKPSDNSWTRVTSSVFVNNLAPVQITKKGTKIFVVDISKNVYESSDNGDSWIKKNGTSLPDVAASLGATRLISIGEDLYIAAGGVWKSSDDGDSWTRIDKDFELSFGLFVDTRSLYYDGANLYSSVYAKKTYKSTDKGSTWTDMGQTEHFFISMTVHNNKLYAAGFFSDSLYVDGGSISTSIVNGAENQGSLYPNPFSEKATLKVENVLKNGTLNIYNSDGRLIQRLKGINGNTIEITRNNLASGMYFYQLNEGAKVITKGKYTIK